MPSKEVTLHEGDVQAGIHNIRSHSTYSGPKNPGGRQSKLVPLMVLLLIHQARTWSEYTPNVPSGRLYCLGVLVTWSSILPNLTKLSNNKLTEDSLTSTANHQIFPPQGSTATVVQSTVNTEWKQAHDDRMCGSSEEEGEMRLLETDLFPMPGRWPAVVHLKTRGSAIFGVIFVALAGLQKLSYLRLMSYATSKTRRKGGGPNFHAQAVARYELASDDTLPAGFIDQISPYTPSDHDILMQDPLDSLLSLYFSAEPVERMISSYNPSACHKEQAVTALEPFCRDAEFGRDVHEIAKSFSGEKAFDYHMRYGNPFPGPFQNLAHHAVDLMFVFQTYYHLLSDKLTKASEQMERHWINIINGGDTWPVYSEGRTAMCYGTEEVVALGQKEDDVGRYELWERLGGGMSRPRAVWSFAGGCCAGRDREWK